MSGPSASHYQRRARGLCALCLEPMNDAEDRLHHPVCDRLYWCGCRVKELRAMTKDERLALAKSFARKDGASLVADSAEILPCERSTSQVRA